MSLFNFCIQHQKNQLYMADGDELPQIQPNGSLNHSSFARGGISARQNNAASNTC